VKKHRLKADLDGERLDVFLARSGIGLSRAYARRLVEEGLVLIHGARARPAGRLKRGDTIDVSVPEAAAAVVVPQDLPLEVLYESPDLIVVNKPAGMPVHPSAGHASGTLVNVLLARYPDIGPLQGELRPGIVHRLDKDTSGAMVVARTAPAQANLARQIKERTVEKRYLAIVEGRLQPPEGLVDAPVGRHPRDRKRQAVVEGGREARTRYRTLHHSSEASLLDISLETGRTHQIRVHMAALGHPVVGDAVYGRRSTHIPRQALHSWRLGFTEPSTGQWLEVEAPPPADFEAALLALGLAGGLNVEKS
jgi:23S rRNA pseudouridine1911/1915/1917 synthase